MKGTSYTGPRGLDFLSLRFLIGKPEEECSRDVEGECTNPHAEPVAAQRCAFWGLGGHPRAPLRSEDVTL